MARFARLAQVRPGPGPIAAARTDLHLDETATPAVLMLSHLVAVAEAGFGPTELRATKSAWNLPGAYCAGNRRGPGGALSWNLPRHNTGR